jgi:hypothetical protein
MALAETRLDDTTPPGLLKLLDYAESLEAENARLTGELRSLWEAAESADKQHREAVRLLKETLAATNLRLTELRMLVEARR